MGALEKAREQRDKALARARQAAKGNKSSSPRTVAGVAAGATAAGLADSKFGEGTATLVGLLITGASWYMSMPDGVHVGVGLMTPACYRTGLTIGAKYLPSSDSTTNTETGS